MALISELLEYKSDKQKAHDEAFNFYDSVVQLSFLSDKMRTFFNRNPIYNQNWCATIVNAVTNKLGIDGFVFAHQPDASGNLSEDARAGVWGAIWDRNGMQSKADLVHEHAHVCGEGFVIPDVLNGEVRAFVQDPRSIVALYNGPDPDQITQAAKFFVWGGRHHARVWELMDDGRVWTQDFDGGATTSRTESGADASAMKHYIETSDAIRTEYTRVPVFHFRRSLRHIKPEFYQVVDIQKCINHVNTALGYSAENAAMKIRAAITRQDLADVRRDLEPGGVLQLEPAALGEQPVSVMEMGAEDLAQYISIIDAQINYMGSITATPRHYFADAGVLSGEALQAMEAPLIAKVERYMRLHAEQWEDLCAFMLTMDGSPTSADEVTCAFKDPHTTLTITQAQARLTNVQAGLPLTTQLRLEGWRRFEIENMLIDRDNERTVDLDEAQLQEVYDRMSTANARLVEPLMKEALDAISVAALDVVARSKLVERAVAAPPEAAES